MKDNDMDAAQGITFYGHNANSAGQSVSPAGDFDGDGKQDWLIGAALANNGAGQVYVVFSQGLAAGEEIMLDTLGTQGITFNGANNLGSLSLTGREVALAGDIDGDGKQDWLIGAPLLDEVYVVFSQGLTAGDVVFLDTLGTQGIKFIGQKGGYTGWSLAAIDDFNGDNKTDWLIGAPSATAPHHVNNNIRGQVYLVFSEGLQGGDVVHLTNLGNQGITFNGEINTSLGYGVSSAGDFDNDNKTDCLLGAPGSYGHLQGKAYVVFSQGLQGGDSIDLGNLGTGGITFEGASNISCAGQSVSLAGDFDSDGKQDWLIGSDCANDFAGQAYVVFSEGLEGGETLNLGELGGQGITINGIADSSTGYAVNLAGDVDNDGKQDWLISAPANSALTSKIMSRVAVVFSQGLSGGDIIHLEKLGQQGIMLEDVVNSDAGESVNYAMDTDGNISWLVGAPGNQGTPKNYAYVVSANGLQGGDIVQLAELANTTETINALPINTKETSTLADDNSDYLPDNAFIKDIGQTPVDSNSEDIFEAEESSTISGVKFKLPDIGSTGMLAVVLGRLVTNAAEYFYEAGKYWWNGEKEVFNTAKISKQGQKQALAAFESLEKQVQKLLKREGLEKWHHYSLEDLLRELNEANTNQLTLEQVKEWQTELEDIEAGYKEAVKETVKTGKHDTKGQSSFFKPKQQPVMPEQQAALPQPQAQQRITA